MARMSVLTFGVFLSVLSCVTSQNQVDTFSMSPGDTLLLQTPNFPQNYPTDYRNQWEYSCSPLVNTSLVLECPVFALQSFANCGRDRLVIASRGQRVVKCGSDNPAGITSQTGWMRLTFYSNSIDVYQGFNCSVTCMVKSAPTIDPGFVTESTPSDFSPLDCGTYTLTAGQEVAIQTINFPQPHDTTVRCQWEFSCPAEANHTLSFNCPSFELESSENCVWDRLVIASRGSRDVMCGSDSPDGTVTSTGWARLTFFANDFTVRQGFRCYITCQAN